MVIRLRGWHAIAFLLAIALAPVALIAFLRITREPGPPTYLELVEREQQLANQGAGPEARLELAVEYGGFVQRLGGLIRAHKATTDMLDENPDFAQKPEIVEKRAFMDEAYLKVLRNHGVPSQEAWHEALGRATHAARQALAHSELTPSQRVAALTAYGRSMLYSQQPQVALQAAEDALRMDEGSVLAALLKADALVDLGQYQAAIVELRAVNLRVTAWANREPDWELKLAWSTGGPIRSSFRERRWKERRAKAAADMRHVISSEIMILQGLVKIQEKIPDRANP